MKRLRKYPKQYPWRIVGTIVIVAAIGTTLIIGSRAASPYASQEAESGVISGATQQTASDASAGKYVQFGSIPSSGGGGDTSARPDWDGSADLGWTIWTTPPAQRQDSTTSADNFGPDTLISRVATPAQFAAAGIRSSYSWRFFIGSEQGGAAGPPRAEMADGHAYTGEKWFGDAFYVPSGENQTNTWLKGFNYVIWQWHPDDSRANRVGIMMRSDDNGPHLVFYDGVNGYNGYTELIPPGGGLLDKIHRMEAFIRFSGTNQGYWEVWIDGSKVASGNAPTVYTDTTTYFKQGVYGPAPSPGRAIYQLGIMEGNSRDAVRSDLQRQ